jgi:hypothetical protein
MADLGWLTPRILAHAVLKMTFKALRHVSLDPSMIGDIVAAALVLLHIEHNRTT